MDHGELIERLRNAVEGLPEGLRDHVLHVEEEAVRLARVHGLDVGRVRVTVLAHDLARAESPARLLELAGRYGVDVDEVERAAPILVHGPIAARILARDFGYHDAEALAAIEAHTTARPSMSRLEKLLFVADKIEPDKVSRKRGLAEARDLAIRDIDGAMLRALDVQLIEAVERGWQVHPRTVEARNELLAGRERIENG